MARLFAAASSEKITFSIGAAGFDFGPGTCAAILRITADSGSDRTIIQPGTGANWSFYVKGSDKHLTMWNNTATSGTSTTLNASDGWALVAMTKASGTVAPRFHKYIYATNTHTHVNASGTLANPGVCLNTGIISNFWNGDIAVIAVWNLVFSDAQIESLPFSLGPWFGPASPSGLWLLDQATTGQKVVDWSGGGANESAITGSAVSTGSVPIWTPGIGPSVGRAQAVAAVAGRRSLSVLGVG